MLKRYFLAAALAVGLAGCAAPSGGTRGAAPTDAADVAAASERLRVAMLEPDVATLAALVATDLNYGHSGGKVDTKAVFIQDLLDKKPDFTALNITDQSVKVLDGGMAVVRHMVAMEFEDTGRKGKASLRVVGVWQKQGGAWRLLVRQAVPAPNA